FLVRTIYLSVIALVLAYMGQGLLEQGRRLVGLHSAATYICAGGSVQDILDRTADCLTDLLEAESVAVAFGSRELECSHVTMANLDQRQGECLVRLSRSWMAEVPRPGVPSTRLWKRGAGEDPRPGEHEALDGVREMLITRMPGTGPYPGVL